MSHALKNWAMLVVLAMGTVAVADEPKQKSEPAPIKAEMDELYIVLSNLLPNVINKAAFEDPKNRKTISQQMQKLQKLSDRMVAYKARFKDSDPSINFISERFQADIRLAIDLWNETDYVVPRNILRNVTDYCISCHTRNSKGAHFAEIVPPSKIKSMPALSRAEFFAATRQYDLALKAYEDLLVEKPTAKTNPDEWDNAVRKMLAITVRVKKDPALTTELLSRIQDSPENMLDSLRYDIAVWRQAAKAWSNEKRGEVLNEEQKFSFMTKLFSEAKGIAEKQPGSALVEYLRLSSMLHEELSTVELKANRQKMLWMAGQASDYLRIRNIWSLQDAYYEKCITTGADAILAKQCYDALEASLFQSTGVKSFAGLPDYIKNHLNSFKIKLKR